MGLGAKTLRVGIDMGSTTAKVVVLDEDGSQLFGRYERHNADVKGTVLALLSQAREQLGDVCVAVAVTGSGGLALAQGMGVPFVQEVIASKTAVEQLLPQTDVAIELGGEDAKIVYFGGSIEQRMNGTCAGGTGAFIDQMAVLLATDAAGLDALAADHERIYPIASRCGVFAKTDVQPLVNEGARREDIAASVLQAVVNQTIAGLACGRPITGHVAFLGGPLHYLPQLRRQFVETLGLDEEHTLQPAQSHLFVALGAALCALPQAVGDQAPAGERATLGQLQERLAAAGGAELAAGGAKRLPALFANTEERASFEARHAHATLREAPLAGYEGDAYLGIDAGSTTFKLALVDEQGRLLYSHYTNNGGDVLSCARGELAALYDALAVAGAHPRILHATTTGYGEELVKAALRADSGEVETVAHLTAASELLPGCDLIIDIGGQDMKCMHAKEGRIDGVVLNEACSSGCGSFLETYAKSLGVTPAEFSELAMGAKHPVDLGSRCTVFMNSRVKQAQKEGAELADIAAGLCYSVVKNALFKVIKARDPKALGTRIVVQGGTFRNDAVLRAFELACGREVVRPGHAELMGAWGAALLARQRALQATAPSTSTLLDAAQVRALECTRGQARCGRCANNCQLTITSFGTGTRRTRHITGNRCERGGAPARAGAQQEELPNLFDYKLQRLFAYEPLAAADAPRGTVGIPRALNMFENYPFWHTLFTQLGYRVELSSPSTKETFQAGMGSIPSESVCYPAKLAHGHIAELVEKDVDFIWMPCIRHERQEDDGAGNCFNCPIVSSYPEALRLNVDELATSGVPLLDPYLPYRDKRRLAERLHEELGAFHENSPRAHGSAPTSRELRDAVEAAWAEDEAFKHDLHEKGRETLAWLERTGKRGIVLAGRPYHLDAEVNHRLPQLVGELGFAVLTEDSVAWMAEPERPLRAVDQWMYHSRLYAAAKLVTTTESLDLVQLNSFGCGLDAITTDQVAEILEPAGKPYTVLKIDEVSNLGAARIRLRSLAAALQARSTAGPTPVSTAFPKARYTRQMKREGYTIIAPQLSPTHFELLQHVFRAQGHNLQVLPADDGRATEAGLRYVNNDICYPSILVVGQIMAAVESGAYDLNRLAVLVVQTGGGCRATNYISLIRKALKEAGHGHIPVISLSFGGTDEHNPGFGYTPQFVVKAYYALVLGDVLMQGLYRTRPYELHEGDAMRLYRRLMDEAGEQLPHMTLADYGAFGERAVRAFDTLALCDEPRKPRVGVVGEILVKFHPTANNHLVELIEAEGCEAVVPGFADFFTYAGLNTQAYRRYLDGSRLKAGGGKAMSWAIEHFRTRIDEARAASRRFERPRPLAQLARKAQEVLQLCNTMGEGWLLTAETIELVEQGAPNIVVCSPFACLPNHVVGKATIKELRARYPQVNVTAIDYDPGASTTNQHNRLKLMIAIAKQRTGSATPGTGVPTGTGGHGGHPKPGPHTLQQPELPQLPHPGKHLAAATALPGAGLQPQGGAALP